MMKHSQRQCKTSYDMFHITSMSLPVNLAILFCLFIYYLFIYLFFLGGEGGGGRLIKKIIILSLFI